ncbi:MAG: hypothetical protein AAGK04_04410 [Planctomycetota bacterium]
MKHKANVAIVLGAGLLVLSACEAPPPPAAPTARADALPPENYPRITVEPGLNDWILVVYDGILQRGGPDADGFVREPMFVQTPIRSAANEQITIQHRYLWFDDRGELLHDGGWRFTPVELGVQTLLSGNALDFETTGWRLEIRSAR